MANGSLMKVESNAECSPWSILQYFWPALRDNQSWKTIFGLLSGRFRQVLLFMYDRCGVMPISMKFCDNVITCTRVIAFY